MVEYKRSPKTGFAVSLLFLNKKFFEITQIFWGQTKDKSVTQEL